MTFRTQRIDTDALSYDVFNSAGVKIQSGIISSGEIAQLQIQSPGIYLLVLSNGKTSFTNKIMY